MSIKDILQGRKLQSNLTPIARMGAPVRSWQSRAADMIQTPDSSLGLLGSKGNWVSGLASAVKSGLGFYGAMKDYENQKAYNENLAQMAEQERMDKLAQQDAEEKFRRDKLAQELLIHTNQLGAQRDYQNAQFENQKTLKQMEIDAANARAKTARNQSIADRDAQWAHEQELRDLVLKQQGIDPTKYGKDEAYTKQVNDMQAAKKAYEQYINDVNAQAAKNLTFEDYVNWRENPSAYDIDGRGWTGRKLGVRSGLTPKVTSANFGVQGETAQTDPLGFIPATGLNKL